MTDLQALLDSIAREISTQEHRSRVADYIPESAKLDDRKFGMAVVTVEGRCYATGDATEALSIQSISKLFTLTLALGRIGNSKLGTLALEKLASETGWNVFAA